MNSIEGYNEIKKLLSDLDFYKFKQFNADKVAEIEAKLIALKQELPGEQQSTLDNQLYIPYPEHHDSDFYDKIYRKKEFYKSKYPFIDSSKPYSKHVAEKCSASSFRLTQNQVFLKNFLSPHTPYNGILLFHSVGTGKTCSAISIAEQFKSVFDKKVLVLMPTNLKENFRKQIYDVNKVEQCTRTKYIDQVPGRLLLKKDVLEKRVNKIIHDNYEFMGFQEFANSVNRIKDNIERIHKKAEIADAKFRSRLKEVYSNRVIIIDEVHNVRSVKDDTQRIVPPILMKVLQTAENVKLILLTATPMFNNAREIVWLINLLLANDKKPLLNPTQLFDYEDKLTDKGKQQFIAACKGYISYMRGENPFSFPIRLYPSINNDPNIITSDIIPAKDIKGKAIPKEKQIRKLEIITSPMEDYQSKVYSNAEKVVISMKDDDDDQDDEQQQNAVVDDDQDDAQGSIVQQLVQISNIVYPTSKTIKTSDISSFYGKTGFMNCFDKSPGSKTLKVAYKKSILTEYGEFLHPNNIQKYSPKIKRIIDYIKQSEGIVYVFSYFIWSGIVPLAIALEHLGFAKYNDTNILSKHENPAKRFEINGKQATYAVLAKDKMLSPSFEAEIEKIRSEANKNGQEIKVILGSNVSAEGIDFKCIREIHLLEPWYHLNKVEQVVGRAIRTCSHIALPESQRNVTIYHHATHIPGRDKETIDLRIYRVAENKQSSIDQIERLLRSYAIDCNINKNALYFDAEALQMSIAMRTSQGTEFFHDIGDSVGKYKDQVTCAHKLKEQLAVEEIDNTTFNIEFYADDIDLYCNYISNLFLQFSHLTYTEIMVILRKTYNLVNEDIVKYALEHMIRTRYTIKNKEYLEGYILYKSDKYMFQPNDLTDTRITIATRSNYKPFRVKRVKIDDNIQYIETQKPQTPSSSKPNTNKASPSPSKSPKVTSTNIINLLKERIDKTIDIDLILNRTVLPKVTSAVYDFVIDRLSENDLLELCSAMIPVFDSNDEHIRNIRHSLETGYIMYTSSTISSDTYIRNVYRKDDPNIMVYNGKHFKPVNAAGMQTFKQFPKAFFVTTQKLKDLKGFADIDKTDGIVKLKLIKENKKSTGTFCIGTSTLKISDLKDSINSIDPQVFIESKKYIKDNLCNLYEMLLRTVSPAVFARPYQASVIKKND